MPRDGAEPPSAALWGVGIFGEDRRLARSSYWWDNRSRRPHDVVVVQCTLHGKMWFRDQRGLNPVPTGHAALFAFGEDTEYGLTDEATETYTCLYANLHGAGLREHWDLLRTRHGSVVRFGDADLHGLRRLISLASPRRTPDALAMATAVHGFVIGLFTALGKELRAAQTPVERAVDEMVAHPTLPWTLKQVADRFGCSREHLSRVFAERVGMPPAAWLNCARLAKALSMLRETRLPIAAIAEQCGYSSTHTLARQVRAQTGKAPTALR